MKHSLLLLLLWIISLCTANDLLCQLFDENAKLLAIYCENYRGAVPMDCTDDIYTIESSQVAELKTTGCDEDTVLSFIQQFRRIRSIDISHSEFRSLSWLDIKIDQVVKFNVSHNELTEFTAELFKKLPDIVEIDLSFNHFQDLNVTSFRGATHLSKIQLSNNLLDNLAYKIFWDSYQLQTINLNNNYFTNIPIFPNNDQLKTIYLTENPIATFDCSHFTSMPFVSVFISWKYLISFFGHMDCQGKRLRVIRDSPNEAILPAWSGKYELHCNTNGFSNLRYFMAGVDGFENVTDILPCLGASVTYLDLSGNYIGKLASDAFERFIDLSRLYLRDTQLTAFDFNMLQNQQYLIVLDLSYNDLQHIDNISRLQRIHLDEFKVSKNALANTPEIIDYLQSSIERLDVSGNFLGELNEDTLQRFNALKTLKLSDTALFLSNDYNPFRLLADLTVLDISHNSLDTLNYTVLAITLNQLREFYAADCEITNALDVIAHLSSAIEVLDLSENSIIDFRLNATHFEMLRNLRFLNLSSTNLMSIEYGTFHHQTMLETLDLSNNHIEHFDVWLLSDKLERLYLDRNELKEISNFEQIRFPRLKWLAVSENWLRMEFLQQLINQTSIGGIEFIGNPYDQKQMRASSSTSQRIGDFLNTVYDKVKFW